MKAIVSTAYGKPDVLRLREVQKPVPGERQVLIKVAATTVTPSDCCTRQGSPWMARLFSGLTKPKKPILGVEFSGVVETVGREVKRLKPGDRVFGSAGLSYGTYAEFVCLSEDEAIVPKPIKLEDGEAASLADGGLTALNFLKDQVHLEKGQKILINGASGAVGTYAVQLAKYFGAEVTGVCSTGNLEWVTFLGADHVMDYKHEDFTRSGKTYDVIFDAIGKSSFSRCKDSLAKNGLYMTTVPDMTTMMRMLFLKKVRGRKALFSATGLRKVEERMEGLRFLGELAASGKIKAVMDKYYTLEQMAEAHRYVEAGHKKGNVVVKL